MIHERELEFRRGRFAQIRSAMRAAGGVPSDGGRGDGRSALADQLLDHLRTFLIDNDLDAFRASLNQASAAPDFASCFPGYNFGVGMFLNQLVDAAPERDELITLLDATLRLPNDDSEGEQRLNLLVDYVDRIRQGNQPASKSAVIFLSFFWWLQHPAMWPFLWPASDEALRRLGWLRSDQAPVESYLGYRDIVRTVHDNDALVEQTLAWFSAHPWTGLDVGLADRLAWAQELNESWDGKYPDGVLEVVQTDLFAALAEMRILGDHLENEVSEATGRPLRRHIANIYATRNIERVRDDVWVKWKLKNADGWNEAPSIHLLVRVDSVTVGFSPGRRERGWAAALRPLLDKIVPDGLEYISLWADPVTSPNTGEFIIGRRFDSSEVLGDASFANTIVAIAAAVQPLMDRTVDSVGLTPTPDPESAPELQALHARFLAERGYPIEKDTKARAKRVEFAELLRCDRLDVLTAEEFRLIFNSSFYGFAGNQSILNTTLNDGDPDQHARVVAALRVLLCGSEPVDQRINRCLDPDDLGIKGLGESVIMKLLSITDPDRFVPVFPVAGGNGKAVMLSALGAPVPPANADKGARQVQANDKLRSLLEPLFPGDPWAMGQFAFWARGQLEVPPDVDPLDAVVEDCYLPDRSFIDELVDLLDDKGQIVLYGPPGTGKTFVARKLAEALAPSDQLRRFVQFHPSTSYEDFFEGYRPDTDAGGNLSYTLKSGPFAQLADHAAVDLRQHVLVVDELNRANIPKVFGELLFLLEYRDQSVSPLYRDEFSLPENLWVIATMNTADRSIASLDAALRRRFHFVPIFPDDGPMEGLLDRYLEREGGDRQWARLLNMVNGELREQLGSGDQLIGPSHFLRSDLDEARMQRIWRYNIEPLMDDLFYGDRATITQFHWPEVIARFRKSAASTDVPATPEQSSDESAIAIPSLAADESATDIAAEDGVE
ncbi:MAG: AAA family ATPase [Microthrixaceae bacterium]